MKTTMLNYLSAPFIAMLMLLSACHSHKDSSEVADSANKKEIAKNDSANKANIKSSDSTVKAKKTLQDDASKFLVKSYESGMYEIELSKLAATNSLVADVKKLAADLVMAHTSINEKISAIAASANFVLPTAVNADHQKDLTDMAKLTGTEFDKKYVNTIISGHEKSVSNYKDAAKDLTVSDTKAFAQETLPKIEEHLSMAKTVKNKIK